MNMVVTAAPARVFKALQAPFRRHLLFALLEGHPQSDTKVALLDLRRGGYMAEEGDAERLQLIHIHLPKLDGWGYIEWERETGQISKGPNWDEIAPLLDVLHDHQDELPDEWE